MGLRWCRKTGAEIATLALFLMTAYGLTSVLVWFLRNDPHAFDSSEWVIPGAAQDRWESFYGTCLPQTHYTRTHLTSEGACHKLCTMLPACVAFSFDSDLACTITTACSRRDATHVGTTTFLKPGVVKTTAPTPQQAAAQDHEEEQLQEQQQPARRIGEQPDASVDKCDYCPPQDECEQPRLCRAGRCFRGLPLPNGTPCGDGDKCRQGKCIVAGNIERITRRDRRSSQPRAYRLGSMDFDRLQDAFHLQADSQCGDGYTVAKIDASVEDCARECLVAGHHRCMAFSVDSAGLMQCILFEKNTNCRATVPGWTTGSLKASVFAATA